MSKKKQNRNGNTHSSISLYKHNASISSYQPAAFQIQIQANDNFIECHPSNRQSCFPLLPNKRAQHCNHFTDPEELYAQAADRRTD